MAVIQDAVQQLASYRGILGWSAYTQAYGSVVRPNVEVELFCKEHSVPIRKPKLSEQGSIEMLNQQDWSTGANFLFQGAPDLLTITLSGWVITPVTKSPSTFSWNPKDVSSSALTGDYANRAYTDIIAMYIEGELNKTVTGAWQRKDPDYYITPQGQKYSKPIVATFEANYTPVPRKQQFQMTLYLEH